jgi:2-dehydropantoate 2-reductase
VVVVRKERLSEYPDKFMLERPDDTVTGRVRVATELAEPVDVLWIATKTFQLQASLQSVKTVPKLVVPLLNGADHVGALRQRFGAERVVPATIGVEAEKVIPGKFRQRSPFVRLNIAASGEPLLKNVVERLSERGLTCQFIANEQTLLWSKLCFLGPFALATSASGLNNGGVAASPEWKHRLDQGIQEACAVATALGAEVDSAKIQAFIASASPEMRSSMQKDVEGERPLELEDIAGPILNGAKQHGVAVPATKGLVELIHAKVAAGKSD